MALIPDISYHLVFCFLQLKELPLVAQCSKEWNRLATNPSFLVMFKHNDVLNLNPPKNNEIIDLTPTSPFLRVIRKIKFSNHFCSLDQMNILIHFTRLKSLNLKIRWSQNLTNREMNFDITHLFQALSSELIELSIEIFKNTNSVPPVALCHFQTALSLLTSLKILKIRCMDENIIQDISFLSHMKNLRVFSCNCISDVLSSSNALATNLSFCKKLLHLQYMMDYDDPIPHLRDLCTGLENSKLSSLYLGYDPLENQDYECFQLLNKLKHLKKIVLAMPSKPRIPISLGKWIHSLFLVHRPMTDQDVIDIIGLPFLKSIHLLNCTMDGLKMKALTDGLAPRLEEFTANADRDHIVGIEIPFESLSKCDKLKTLALTYVTIDEREYNSLSSKQSAQLVFSCNFQIFFL
jgi:hypothetical protein